MNTDLLALSRQGGFRLLRKTLVYHAILLLVLVLLAMFAPGFIEQLPIGGVTDLVRGGEVNLVDELQAPIDDSGEIVETVIRATGTLDRLGYARELTIVLLGVWLLMLPVSWVHKCIHRFSSLDHSLDETTLILPGIVAAIVLVVQHSLALAFSLAGIVAGVHFRRALQDTFDALFILVAIGTGIAGGVRALEIAAVLTVFFTYATLYVHLFGDGLESDFIAQQKALKHLQRESEADQHRDGAAETKEPF